MNRTARQTNRNERKNCQQGGPVLMTVEIQLQLPLPLPRPRPRVVQRNAAGRRRADSMPTMPGGRCRTTQARRRSGCRPHLPRQAVSLWPNRDPVQEKGWRTAFGIPSRSHGQCQSSGSQFSGNECRQTKQLAPSNGESLLYSFCWNNPLGAVDLWGLDIYLQEGDNTGNSIKDRWHVAVCVDTYDVMPQPGHETPDPTGKVCFSFGIKEGFGGYLPVLPGLHWLGFHMPHPGSCLRGIIYSDPWTGGNVIAEYYTTPMQDWRWQSYMRNSRVYTEDAYTLLSFNCRAYSVLEFLDAPNHF
jgi:hypothetical protein